MNTTWESFVNALGEHEDSSAFCSLLLGIGEPPMVSNTPDEFNDPLGKTKFFAFLQSGIELGVRQDKLTFIHFFMQPNEGYQAYTGPLTGNVDPTAIEETIVKTFGAPSKSGGGKLSALLGFVNRWVKYNQDHYSLRFEFSEGKILEKITLTWEGEFNGN